MNHLVVLDAQAGELEKILSGLKTMLVKENDPSHSTQCTVNPGDVLYFLRNKNDSAPRVRATVVRILHLSELSSIELLHALKEMQPRLQLTEDQYGYWSVQRQFSLVEFESAHKINIIHLAPDIIRDGSSWIAFEDLSLITRLGD